jgi:uncharacterized membrane protein
MKNFISTIGTQLREAFKRYFLAGFLILVPLGATFSLIKFLLKLSDELLKSDDGKFFYFLPPEAIPTFILNFPIPGLGLVFIVFIILLMGVITRNIFGRKLVRYGEGIIEKIPLIRKIFFGIKQIVETIVATKTDSFKRAVLIEYPRLGIYTIAFVTGRPSLEIEQKTGKRLSSVFVPTTPNPTSGFYLFVPTDELINLDISVDVALKAIISTGIVPPEDPNKSGLREKVITSGLAPTN